MIEIAGKNWIVLEKQPGIRRLLDSFDPEEKKFSLMSSSMDSQDIAQILNY